MRDMNTLTRILVLLFCGGSNLALGVFNLHTRHWVKAAISFTAASFVIGIHIAGSKFRNRLQIERLRLEREIEAARGVFTMTAIERARENLIKVCTALDATYLPANQAVKFETRRGERKYQFTICTGMVYCGRWGSTCFYVAAPGAMPAEEIAAPGAMPAEEILASALLLLSHDPEIFGRWQGNHGQPFV